jgi:hypothetical protein
MNSIEEQEREDNQIWKNEKRIRVDEREKVLDELLTECLFLSDGSFECSAICDKIRGAKELRQGQP